MIFHNRSIRESTTCLLDMRIGVHSGNVLCGVLGTVKWKYDIWSDDVRYANFLEQTGEPGYVIYCEFWAGLIMITAKIADFFRTEDLKIQFLRLENLKTTRFCHFLHQIIVS